MGKKLLLAALLTLLCAGTACAQEQSFQLSFFDPYQTVADDQAITGARLGIFYTVNTDVRFFSWTFFGVDRAKGNFSGVQFGLANYVEGEFHGWQYGIVNITKQRFIGFQDGFVNITKGDFTGLQWGLWNCTEGSFFHGVQAGVVNIAKGDFKGFAIGIVNWTDSLKGLQIGLINYNGKKDPFEFLPIVNWSF